MTSAALCAAPTSPSGFDATFSKRESPPSSSCAHSHASHPIACTACGKPLRAPRHWKRDRLPCAKCSKKWNRQRCRAMRELLALTGTRRPPRNVHGSQPCSAVAGRQERTPSPADGEFLGEPDIPHTPHSSGFVVITKARGERAELSLKGGVIWTSLSGRPLLRAER